MKASDLDRVYGKAGALPKTARFLLLYLSYRCRPDGTLPMDLKDDQVAASAGCSDRAILRARKVLEQRGVLEHANAGANGVRYRILIPALVDADEVALPFEAAQ